MDTLSKDRTALLRQVGPERLREMFRTRTNDRLFIKFGRRIAELRRPGTPPESETDAAWIGYEYLLDLPYLWSSSGIWAGKG